MVAGETRVEGGTLTMLTPTSGKNMPILIPKWASSTLVECNFEPHMIAPLDTTFSGTYKMRMERCTIFMEKLKTSQIMTVKRGDSNELRELVEDIIGAALGIEIAIDGEFIWENDGITPTGNQNSIFI
jgi:hypothetical protein